MMNIRHRLSDHLLEESLRGRRQPASWSPAPPTASRSTSGFTSLRTLDEARRERIGREVPELPGPGHKGWRMLMQALGID